MKISPKQKIPFLWQDGRSIVQIALAIQCSAREVEVDPCLSDVFHLSMAQVPPMSF